MARSNITFAQLVACAQRVGVKVVSAPSSHRGQKGKMGSVVGVTLHHTGTPNSLKPTQDYLDYQVVKEGRPGLENSLSAFGIGRHEAIYVFSEDLSWHAGTWNYAGITDGNGHFLGIEAAGVGDWTEFQLKVYPRLVASILLFLGEGVDMMPRHADGAMPRGRKTDAARLPGDFKGQVAYFMAHPSEININATEPNPEEILMDIASLKLVNAPDNPNVVWLTNGLRRRLMLAGEPEVQIQLGLAEPHVFADEAKGVKEVTVATIAAWMIDRIPIEEGSGWLPDQGVYRYADDVSANSVAAIAGAVVDALPENSTASLGEVEIARIAAGVVAALPPVTGGNPPTAEKIAEAVRAELARGLA